MSIENGYLHQEKSASFCECKCMTSVYLKLSKLNKQELYNVAIKQHTHSHTPDIIVRDNKWLFILNKKKTDKIYLNLARHYLDNT